MPLYLTLLPFTLLHIYTPSLTRTPPLLNPSSLKYLILPDLDPHSTGTKLTIRYAYRKDLASEHLLLVVVKGQLISHLVVGEDK